MLQDEDQTTALHDLQIVELLCAHYDLKELAARAKEEITTVKTTREAPEWSKGLYAYVKNSGRNHPLLSIYHMSLQARINCFRHPNEDDYYLSPPDHPIRREVESYFAERKKHRQVLGALSAIRWGLSPEDFKGELLAKFPAPALS